MPASCFSNSMARWVMPAGAGRAAGQLAGLGLGGGEEALEIVDGELGVDHQDFLHAHHQRDGRDVLGRVVGHLGHQICMMAPAEALIMPMTCHRFPTLATKSTPVTPAAPLLFSTRTDWPMRPAMP